MSPARSSSLAAMLVAAAVLAGCGERRGSADGVLRTTPVPAEGARTPLGRTVATAEVSLSEYILAPSDPTISRSGVIALVAMNDGDEPHALEIDGPTRKVRSRVLQPGQRATIVARLPPGSYKWVCPLADHEERGMTGRVRVAG